MSVKHLGRYVNEFAGRNNVRTLDTVDQMKKFQLYTKCYGVHLTVEQLPEHAEQIKLTGC